jgi:glutamine---fructose-6-phosphate transaminase (isomerizing)
MAEKGGYKHFMLKEIFEQPAPSATPCWAVLGQETPAASSSTRWTSPKRTSGVQQMKIVACGTSWHAALAGKFMIEKLARVPVEVDYGSEFRYRDPIVDAEVLTVVISQSGETADTLAAQREAKQKGSKTLAICNVVGSMITRDAPATCLLTPARRSGSPPRKPSPPARRAVHPRGVPRPGARTTADEDQLPHLVQELLRIPGKMEAVLSHDSHYDELTKKPCSAPRTFSSSAAASTSPSPSKARSS